jgi:hypothetical protein
LNLKFGLNQNLLPLPKNQMFLMNLPLQKFQMNQK